MLQQFQPDNLRVSAMSWQQTSWGWDGKDARQPRNRDGRRDADSWQGWQEGWQE